MMKILVANLATNFQELVTKMKNLVALVPVLGAISCPGIVWQTVRRITDEILGVKGLTL